MKTSQHGIDLICAHEGLRTKAYYDTGGVPTIGWGHTKGVKISDRCTREQAVAWLREDLGEAENTLKTLVRVPLNQNQFDALVSFVFNIGFRQFENSQMLRLLNIYDYAGAAAQFPRWRYDNKMEVAGLVARRADERHLFELEA